MASTDSVTSGRALIELRLTQLLLALVVVGLFIVGKRLGGWPIITWPMYSQRTNTLPPSTASFVELRVATADGQVHRVDSTEIFTIGRSGIARRVFVDAFTEEDPQRRQQLRRYLAAVLRRNVSLEPPMTIETWELEWDVDPLKLPPLEYDNPRRSARLGGFSVLADGTVASEP